MTRRGARGGDSRVSQRPPDLFTAFPASSYDKLIVRYPDSSTHVAHCFAQSADRLAASFRGRAPDDTLLLPYLYLYRHAFELNLKSCIETAAALRVLEGDTDASLEATEVRRRLQHDHGHRIMALVEELDTHLEALGMEKLPPQSRKLHSLLGTTDPRGESFRYSGAMPGDLGDSQDNIDFKALSTALHDGFSLAQGALSMLEVAYDNVREALTEMADDARQEQRAVEAEYAAELRADFQSYY